MPTAVLGTALESEIFGFGAIPPNVLPDMIKEKPDAFKDDYMKLLAINGETGIPFTFAEHAETPDYESPIHGAGTGAGAPGAVVSWLLPALDYSPSGAISVQIDDTLMFTNGTVGHIFNITGTPGAYTVFVRPTTVTGVIPALAANEAIMKLDRMKAERASFGQGLIPTFTKYRHEMQIFERSYEYSGTSAAAKTFFNFGTNNTTDAAADTYIPFVGDVNQQEYAREIAKSIFYGTPTGTNPGSNYRRLTGLIPWIQNNGGNVLPVAGALTLTDIRQICNQFNSTRAGFTNYTVKASYRRMQEFEDLGLNLFPNGAMVYGSETGLKMAELGWQIFKTSGYNFALDLALSLDDNQSTGLPGYTYPGMMLFQPSGMTQDSMSGKQVPLFEMKYLANGSINRRMQTYLAGPAILGRDAFRVTFIKEIMTDPKLAKAWGLITP